MKNMLKTTSNSSAAGNLQYIKQEWDQIPTPKLQKLITSMPNIFQLFWKEREMLHYGKHAPVPTILRPVAGIKFEMSSFCK